MGLDAIFHVQFQNMILSYKRFVDDTLTVTDDTFDSLDGQMALNSWHASIQVTRDNSESAQCVNFLDIHISVCEGGCVFKTFRKPLSSYPFTPFHTRHPASVFKGIVATEMIRLLRTNAHEISFNAQFDFFLLQIVSEKLPWRYAPSCSQSLQLV